MDEKLMQTFNPPQRAAIEYCDGASLVVAGAGSGKTRVLTYKIAYLMEQGYEPWSILALTFTNKAANEMKERVAKIVGTESARRLWMGTFHSVFLRILRAECDKIGFPSNFTIYDAADSKSLVKAIIKELKLDDKTYKTSAVLGRICDAKNALISPEQYAKSPGLVQADMRANMGCLSEIYNRYSNRCRQAGAMDFDDILVYTYLLFEQNPDVLEKYAQRFRYVLVDEYQDTNHAQHQIVLQLTRNNQHVCVVGDDAQSIYSFRGANIENILTFKDLYPNTKVFKLEQNYRSTQMIVDAANSLIHKNQSQIFKNVFSRKDIGERLPIIDAYSDVEEAQIVVRTIIGLHSRENVDYSQFAILYRTNAQSRLFEEHLRKNGLPYRIYGGLSFYQRKEIKDVIAYFRLAVNPHDEEAFKRVINYPTRGIGNTTLNKIVDTANENEVSLWTVLTEPAKCTKSPLSVPKATATKLMDFIQMIRSFGEKAMEVNAEETGRYIIECSGISRDIYSGKEPEDLSRQENIEELINGLHDFCASRLEEGNENVSITDYLAEVSLLSDVDTDKGDDDAKVTLMTIHSAKGLEFDTVFVVGLEENLFPSQMSGTSMREIEEERRLFYVAITRAQRHCYITYAKSRLHYGKMEFANPSRFLRDIDPQYVTFKGGGMMADSSRVGAYGNGFRSNSYGGSSNSGLFGSRSSFAGSNTNNQYSNRTGYSAGNSGTRYNANPNTSTRTITPGGQFRPVSALKRQHPESSASQSVVSASELAVGKHIQHERFGIGEVLRLEGSGGETKATVQFANAGTKQLLVKYARFTVID